MRTNPVTGRRVVVSPARAGRPVEGDPDGLELPPRDPTCPFCPGNESELPTILEEVPGEGPAGWAARAVPNRYPAFRPRPDREDVEDQAAREDRDPQAAPAIGMQEVVVETPRHDRGWEDFTPDEGARVLRLHRSRWRSAGERHPDLRRYLFWNRGMRAGASLGHAHAQLFALPGAAGPAAEVDRRIEAHRREEGECLLCRIETVEPPGDRVVAETDHFRFRVPWAAEAPCEVWIVPRRHRPDFGAIDDDELADLARHLPPLLRAVRDILGTGDGNLLLHSGPGGVDPEAHHWFLQARPRDGQIAGFEFLTGVIMNPSDPDDDAARLRERIADTGSG